VRDALLAWLAEIDQVDQGHGDAGPSGRSNDRMTSGSAGRQE
jgi:hypothetical protein